MRKRNRDREFFRIKKKVCDTEPDISEMLSSRILDDDKVELFQLFEIYKREDNFSLYKLELKKRITDKYKDAKIKYKKHEQYSEEQHEKFRKEVEMLEKYSDKDEMKYEILNLETSDINKKVIYNEYKRLSNMSLMDEEIPKVKNWLKWSLSIPHDCMKKSYYEKCELKNILKQVSEKMDRELYGMKKVKEQILLFLNSRMLNPNMKKCSFGLLGPPGCGKTSIVRLLADVLNFPFEQISLGGTQSVEFLKGHQYTYMGSEPGEIVKCLSRMGVKNGILFFDEYDKISDNKDVCSSLLHITDSSQNSRFQDNFLSGITIDLSHLWFFYSMNKKPVDEALNDRIFYVTIEGYTQEDKFFIVRDYLLKKACRNVGWGDDSFKMSDGAIKYLIERVSLDSEGIRSLEHAITGIINKINFLYNHQDQKGRIDDFDGTFSIGKKVSLPFWLEKDRVDVLISF